jgi:hypothetical protein
MIRQGCRRKSYSGYLSLSLKLKISAKKQKIRPLQKVVTLTKKILNRPLDKILGGIPDGSGEPVPL